MAAICAFIFPSSLVVSVQSMAFVIAQQVYDMLNVIFHDLCTEYCSTKSWIAIKSTLAFIFEKCSYFVSLSCIIVFSYVIILAHLWLICWVTWIRLFKGFTIKANLCHICTLGVEFTFSSIHWIFESEATFTKLTKVSFLPVNAKDARLIGFIFTNFFPSKFCANWLRI